MTDTIDEILESDLSWLPRVCQYCKAPAELVLKDYNDGNDIDPDGTQVIQFRCCNCGEIVRVRTPIMYFGDMLP